MFLYPFVFFYYETSIEFSRKIVLEKIFWFYTSFTIYIWKSLPFSLASENINFNFQFLNFCFRVRVD